jgi:hypothetical protein
VRGQPYFMRLFSGSGKPKVTRFGVDFAGTVQAVGADVTLLKVGDRVFGGRSGALAEYVVVREDLALALKPEYITFAEAAAVPVAAITALQAVRDKGAVRPGQEVLLNGARAAWACSRRRSPRLMARRSPASAARETSNSYVPSALITRSITSRRTSRTAPSATTSSSTMSAITWNGRSGRPVLRPMLDRH